jgi:stress response protein YsnF
MAGETLVAVYASRAEAERVRDRLRSVGVSDGDIRLSIDTDNDQRFAPVSGERGGAAGAPKQEEGFFDWLFGISVPESDQTWYRSTLREGRTAVSVRGGDGAERERITAILEEFDPIEFEGESAGMAGATASGAAAQTKEGEQVIPVVKEELEVGKRPVERRHRIRTYVVERPVEEQVNLRDERVVVERRPVSGERVVGAEGIQEHEVEVVERHEEPVVAKKAKAVEEVAVRKEAKKRTETVRDKVRETKVEVDKKAAGDKPGTSKTGPASPAPASRAQASREPASRAPARRPTVSGR